MSGSHAGAGAESRRSMWWIQSSFPWRSGPHTGTDEVKTGRGKVAAELFAFIFNSFEAGIANAISSFKKYKIFIIMKYKHFQYWVIGLTNIYQKIFYQIQSYFYWSKTCLKPYIIYRHSRTRVNLCAPRAIQVYIIFRASCKSNSNEIEKVVWSFNQIFIFANIFHHLELEIALIFQL